MADIESNQAQADQHEDHQHAVKTEYADKIPVTVLTGFLGAGKTTLLNLILKEPHGEKIAVIENEFGQTGVDEDILVAREHSNEIIIEVQNGCICCKVRGDLITALKNLYEQTNGELDGVIIETTGLADPGPVAQTFFVEREIERHYFLDAVLTVADSKHLLKHLHYKRPDGAGNEAEEQLAYADKILLNKVDLASEEQIAELNTEIRKINPTADIIQCQLSNELPVPINQLIGLDAFDLERAKEMNQDFTTEYVIPKCDKTVRSIGFNLGPDEQIEMFRFSRFIDALIGKFANDLFRYKGVIAIKGRRERYVFQGVHMLYMGDFASPWGDDERKSCFCFIGRNIHFMNIEKGFRQCIAKPLRWGIGKRVEATVGHDAEGNEQKMEGVVIATWDEGNPYRMRLDDGEEVWAPLDVDHFIRDAPSQSNPQTKSQSDGQPGGAKRRRVES